MEAIINMHLTLMIHTDFKQDYEANKGITILLNRAILDQTVLCNTLAIYL